MGMPGYREAAGSRPGAGPRRRETRRRACRAAGRQAVTISNICASRVMGGAEIGAWRGGRNLVGRFAIKPPGRFGAWRFGGWNEVAPSQSLRAAPAPPNGRAPHGCQARVGRRSGRRDQAPVPARSGAPPRGGRAFPCAALTWSEDATVPNRSRSRRRGQAPAPPARQGRIIVPAPCSVKSSSRQACGARPSMMTTACTPARIAESAVSTFGIMPP